MKILIDHSSPFFLAHGGFQTQIEQTAKSLQEIGLEVEWVRWWDDRQSGDILHYFGRPSASYIDFAHDKGMKVVISELLTGMGSRSGLALGVQKCVMEVAKRALPRSFTAKLAWDAYQKADACTALTPWEGLLMQKMLGAPLDRLFIVPNGVEKEFFECAPIQRGPWLVCTATITERKRVLELAQAAVRAKVPVWFIGGPYSEEAPYFKEFLQLAKSSPDLVRYEGPMNDRSQLAINYRQARGFVLLSSMESLSLSALEAAACEAPLLLSDLPWARTAFKKARFCPVTKQTQITAENLRQFYDAAPQMDAPEKPATWKQIAQKLKEIYEQISRQQLDSTF